MDIVRLTEIYNNNLSLTRITAYEYSSKNLNPVTVRSKGQYQFQRFYYIKGGKTKFVLNDSTTIVCEKGDILYLPPDVTYTSYWEDDPEKEAILIQFDLIAKDKKEILSDEMFIIAHDKHEIYLKQFMSLAKVFNEGRLGYKLKCQSIFFDILYSFIPEFIKTPQSQKNFAISKGILYIENHYMDEINVDEIAKMCSLCPSAFRSQFRVVTGMSPVKYKNYLTMKKAAELLKTGNFTVSEVAEEIGINDIYYFNRVFKNFYHISPGKFKNLHLLNGNTNQSD